MGTSRNAGKETMVEWEKFNDRAERVKKIKHHLALQQRKERSVYRELDLVFPAKKEDPNDETYYTLLRKSKEEFEHVWNKKRNYPGKIDDFEQQAALGCGSFGRVILVRQKGTGKYYAMKILDKEKMMKSKQVEHTLYEKRILQAIQFPFVVNMEYSYQDNSYVYFIMPFINGGEMFVHLRRLGRFDEMLSKFYAAQVCMALEYLHYLDLVYRDLKPENILIDIRGYLKVADFGFCKIVKGRTWTLCGTPEYLAPEIILSKGYGKSVDYWSYGVLLFEMAAGFPPFTAKEPMRIYEKIASGKYRTPTHFSLELKDLIKNLLQIDISRRYGILKNGVLDIKNHRWFKDISYSLIFHGNVEPVYKPVVEDEADTINFEFPHTLQPLRISEHEKFPSIFKHF